MHLLRDTHHQVGWLTGRVNHPRHSGTVIVKGTYRMRRGAAAVPLEEQPELSPDIHRGGDEAGVLGYPSDFAHFKPQADVLVDGTFHAPDERPVTVGEAAFSVGAFSKRLRVVGDRRWISAGGVVTPTRPEPFTAMPLSYERAFGGPRFPQNPLGRGFVAPGDRIDGACLPNVEDPGAPRISPGRVMSPAGFGAVPLTWPQRLGLCGTFDEEWRRTRWPWFPADADVAFQNAAPADQQVSHLAGDETVRLVNLHPTYAAYETRLPGVRPRCFHSPVVGSPLWFRELPLHLDTLWMDPVAELMVIVWRGVLDLRAETFGKQDRLLVVCEALSGPAVSLDTYHQRARLLMVDRLEPDDRDPIMVMSAGEAVDGDSASSVVREEDQGIAGETDAFDAMVATSPPDEMPPPTAAWCLARFAGGGTFDGLDLSGVDLRDVDLGGASFRQCVLVDAGLRRANLRACDFTGAVLSGADLSGADLGGVAATGADFTDARLVRASLDGATLVGADLSRANLRGASLRSCAGRGLVLVRANLLEADATGADLTEADLAHASLHAAVFHDARLRDASIEEASGFPLFADRADLTGLRAAGAILWESSFRDVHAAGSIWQAAELRDSDFSGAVLDGAEFEEADLERADLTCATLRHARLVRANLRDARLVSADLLGASLEGADAAAVDFTAASLFAAETLDGQFDGATLTGANLIRTTLDPVR